MDDSYGLLSAPDNPSHTKSKQYRTGGLRHSDSNGAEIRIPIRRDDDVLNQKVISVEIEQHVRGARSHLGRKRTVIKSGAGEDFVCRD